MQWYHLYVSVSMFESAVQRNVLRKNRSFLFEKRSTGPGKLISEHQKNNKVNALLRSTLQH